MKSLTISCLLLALTAIVVGTMGSYLLNSRIQQLEQSDFQKLLPIVAAQIESTTWQSPPDSDPAWRKLERQLDLDLLPLTAAKGQEALDAQVQRIQRSSSVSGTQRLTATVPLQLSNQPKRLMLQVTREVNRSGASSLWWLSWGLLCLVAVGVAISAIRFGQTQRRKLHGLLEPWLRAVRGTPELAHLLPKIESDSELEPALRIVSEAVNQLTSELSSQNLRSELVLSNLQEGVLAIDESCHVLSANQALHQLLGLPAEPYLNRMLLEIIRIPRFNEVAERVLKDHAPCEVLVEMTRPNRTLRIIGRPLPLGILPGGPEPTGGALPSLERVGALLTVRDETILHRIEAIRRDFVANASHELKTPLAAIRAYAETLQLGALDDRLVAQQFIGNIIEQADRINSLVQGMLQLSRVESGIALKFERFDAYQAAQACLTAAAVVAQGKGVRIEIETPREALEIRCDRDSFHTILSNLLSNAVRYTHTDGQVVVELRLEGPYILMRVTDTGIGISPEDLERIFERFYRADKDRSSQSGGTGLGLSIVKHLVQALGGSVQATSQPGEGSCFEVRLPVEGR